MVDNIKIRTEDVSEILDTKIKTDSAHLPLDVVAGEYYDSVLEKISVRSPTFDEKAALNAAENPSAANPYTTLSRLNAELAGRIPWVSVGPTGSGADFEGDSEAPLVNAIGAGAKWIVLRPGEYTFSAQVEVPADTYILGSSEGSSTITGTVEGPLFLLSGENITLEGFSVIQSAENSATIRAEGNKLTLSHLTIAAHETGKTLDLSDNLSRITICHSKFTGAALGGVNISEGVIFSCYFDTVGVYAIDLIAPIYWSITGSTINGQLHLQDAENVRVLANHLNDGVFNENPVSVVIRGNTPVTVNNESEDFADLLQYLGSPSVQDTAPLYSNNYAGPQGESLTARAGALDLLTQWRYEDRNLQLIGSEEPAYVQWDPLTRSLSTTCDLHLISSHREAHWVIPQLGTWTSLTFASQQVSSQQIAFTGNTQYLGQSFVSPHTGDLLKITVRLKKSSGASGTIRCAMFNTNIDQAPAGGSTSLGHSNTLSLASLSTSFDDVVFEFSSPIRLENGSSYACVFQSTSSISGQAYFATNTSPGSYTGGSVIQSLDGGATWSVIAQDFHFLTEGQSLSSIVLEDGEALYYKLDRNMLSANLNLAPFIGPVGSIPNDRENRNIYVLAYCHNRTIWWRGGNGSRLPATNNQVALYHIDGTSKSIVDYIGALDTNDYYPQYSDNFSGVANEPLVQRLSKTDARIRTLFEYSNMIVEIQSGGTIELEGDALTLTGVLYLYFPHLKSRFYIEPKTWTLEEDTDSIVFASWDQALMSQESFYTVSDGTISNGLLPLPENDGRQKYMVLARRIGKTVQLWNGTELISGSQWPVPASIGRFVVPTQVASILDQNISWTGQDLLWENIALATASGLPLERNSFPNQVTPESGLTDLGPNEGLLVTHSWNQGDPSEVKIEKIVLPVTSIRQNQFLWVQNFSGTIVFGI